MNLWSRIGVQKTPSLFLLALCTALSTAALLLSALTSSASAASVQLTVRPSTTSAGAHPTLRTAVALPSSMVYSPFSRASLASVEVNYGPGLTVDASRMAESCESPSIPGGCPANSRLASVSATASVGGRVLLFGGYIAKGGSVDARGLNEPWLVLEANYAGAPATKLSVIRGGAYTWPNNYCGPTGEGCRTKPYQPGKPVFGNRTFQLPQSFEINGVTRQARFFSLTSQTTNAASARGVVTNPTSCTPSASTAVATLADGSVLTGQSSNTPTQCVRLGFKPAGDVTLNEPTSTKRSNVMWMFGGDTTVGTRQQANIRSASVHIQAADLDADGLADRTVCTLPDADLTKCPESSEIGEVSIVLPFLSKLMKGRMVRSYSDSDASAGGGAKIEKGKIIIINDGEGGIARHVLDLSITTGVDGVDIAIPQLPDMPISAFSLQLSGVVRGSEDCDDYDTSSSFTAWSGAGAVVAQPDSLHVSGCRVTITAGPSEGYILQRNETDFEFVSRSNRGHECLLDDAAKFEPCTSPLHLSGLSEGPHSLSIRAVGCAGCGEPVTKRTWIVDTIAPDVAFTDFRDGDSDGDGFANERFRPAFFDIFAEAVDVTSGIDWESVTCGATERRWKTFRSGGVVLHSQTSGRFSCSFADLPEGDIDVEISVADHGGHVTVLKSSYTVDTTAPALSFADYRDQDDDGDSFANKRFRPAFFDIFVEMSDAGSGVDEDSFACIARKKGGNVVGVVTVNNGNRICSFGELPEGDIEVEISVADHGGHVTVLKRSYTVDSTPPAIAIDEPGVQIIGDPDFDLLAVSTDNSYGLPGGQPSGSCEITGVDWDGTIKGTMRFSPGSTPNSLNVVCVAREKGTGMASGRMVVSDAAGNSTTKFFDIFVDPTPPVLSTTDPKDDDCDGRDDTPDACFRPAFFDIFVEMSDAGSGIKRQSFTATATFSDGVTRQLAVGDLDGDGSPDVVHVTDAPEGLAEIRMSVVDNAGHVTVLKQSVVVDITPPALSTVDPRDDDTDGDGFPDDSARQTQFELFFDRYEEGKSIGASSLECAAKPRKGGVVTGSIIVMSANRFSCSLADLPEGEVDVEITATDAVGNVSVLTRSYRIDGTPPRIFILLPSRGAWLKCANDPVSQQASIPLSFTLSDSSADPVNVEVSFNRGPRQTVSLDGTRVEQTAAINVDCREMTTGVDVEYRVFATDSAGNPAEEAVTFRLDTLPPKVGLPEAIDADDDEDGVANQPYRPASFPIPFLASDAGSGVNFEQIKAFAKYADIDQSDLSLGDINSDGRPDIVLIDNALQGPIEVSLHVPDNSGHVTVLKRKWVIDTNPPDTEITGPPGLIDRNGDGSPDSPYQPASFDVFFNATDDSFGDPAGRRAQRRACRATSKATPWKHHDIQGLDAPAGAVGNSVCSFVGLEDGEWELLVTTTDGAGNTSSQQVDVTVDTVAPSIAIDEPGAHFTGESFFDVFFEVDEQNLRIAKYFIHAIHGGRYASGDCVALGDLDGDGLADFRCHAEGLVEGASQIELVATDMAGNTVSSFVDVFFDNTAPAIALVEHGDDDCDAEADEPNPDSCYRPAFFDVFYELSDVGSGVDLSSAECRVKSENGPIIKGSALGVTSSNIRVRCNAGDVSEGDVDVELSVADATGHVTVLKRSFTVDVTPPAVNPTALVQYPAGNVGINEVLPYANLNLVGDSFFDVFFDVDDASITNNTRAGLQITCSVEWGSGGSGCKPLTCGPDGCASQVCGADGCAPLVCGPSGCAPMTCGPDGCSPTSCGPNGCAPLVCGAAGCGPSSCTPLDLDKDGDGRLDFGCRVGGLPEGRSRIDLSATDAAGNDGKTSFYVFVDTVAPVLELTHTRDEDCDGADPSYNPTACFRPAFFDVFFEATDAGSGVDWSRRKCLGKMSNLQSNPLYQEGRFVDGDGDGVPERCVFENLPEGEVVVEISVADRTGHETLVQRTYTVDSTPPSVQLVSPRDGDVIRCDNDAATGSMNLPIEYRVSLLGGMLPGGAVISAAVGGREYPAVNFDTSSTVQSELIAVDCDDFPSGEDVPYRVTATDAAGNVGEAAGTVRFDTDTPAISFDGAATVFNTTRPSIPYAVSDSNLGTTSCYVLPEVDDEVLIGFPECAPITSEPCGCVLTPDVDLADGAYRLRIVHRDLAARTTEEVHRFTIDKSAPTITFTRLDGQPIDPAVEPEASADTAHTLEFESSEPAVPVCTATRIGADGEQLSHPESRDCANLVIQVGPNAAGDEATKKWCFAVRATDQAGNVGESRFCFVYEPPSLHVTIDSPTALSVVAPLATPAMVPLRFTVAGTGGPVQATCRDNTLILAPACTSGDEFSLAPGSHLLRVGVTDADGDTASDSVPVFVVDPEEAPFSLDGLVEGAVLDTSSVTVQRRRGHVKYNNVILRTTGTCVVDHAEPEVCDDGHVFSELAEGPHVLDVTSFDENGVPLVLSVHFTIDRTAPVIQVGSPENGGLISGSTPLLEFTVIDVNPGTTRCVIDGQVEINPCNSGITLPPQTVGAHTLTIFHNDQAGNAASYSVTFIIVQSGGSFPPGYCPPGYICLPNDPNLTQ